MLELMQQHKHQQTIPIGNVAPAGPVGGSVRVTTDAGGSIVSAVLLTPNSTGYQADSVITIPGGTLQADGNLGGAGTGGDIVLTITAANIVSSITSVSIVEDGAGYVAGNVVEIAVDLLGVGSTLAQHTLVDGDIVNANAFTLETLSEGVIMNNTTPAGSDTGGTELPGGALALGSADNIRWEITSVNTASGVFSLLVRRGNDNNNQKVILESFNNISLDPFSPNYISRAIGDITSNVVVAADGSGTYLQESGLTLIYLII